MTIDEWFEIHDRYYKASDVYNARIDLIKKEWDREDGNVAMNAHKEYKILNDAQKAMFRADIELYETLKKDRQ